MRGRIGEEGRAPSMRDEGWGGITNGEHHVAPEDCALDFIHYNCILEMRDQN